MGRAMHFFCFGIQYCYDYFSFIITLEKDKTTGAVGTVFVILLLILVHAFLVSV